MHEPEIEANLERAMQSVEAARLMLEQGYPDFAASRAYYAAFYAATAALLNAGLTFSTHSSVLSTFHRELVKTGTVNVESGKSLNRLYELRNIGDYGETQHITTAEAETAVQLAASFVDVVQKLLNNNPK